MNLPLPYKVRTLCLGFALALWPASGTFAAKYDASDSAILAEREVVRRQENLAAAQRLIERGDGAMKSGDFEAAYSDYQQALDLIGSGPAVKRQRRLALDRFSRASIRYATWLVHQGRYADAERVAKTVLLPEYNPTYKPAIRFLAHLEQTDYFNKTETPKFAREREEVMKLFVEAEGFYQRGSFDLALKRYEQILDIDPYNIAARRGMERVHQERSKYFKSAYNETRSRMLWEVTKSWERPVRKFTPGKTTENEMIRGTARGAEALTAKLNRIIIPNLELRDTPIREAVEYLRQISTQLDTLEPDPAKRGVNIFLKVAAPQRAPVAADSGLGLPLPGQEEELPAPIAPQAAVTPTEDTRITLSLSNVPVYEALRYLAELSGLKIKIDSVAVSLVPLTEAGSDLITKEYKVPPSFLPNRPSDSPAPGGAAPATAPFGTPPTAPDAPRFGARISAQEYLSSQGVPFPPGASAQYIPQGSRLLVRNTQDNLDVVDRLVDAVAGQAPVQVEIESKFVEINQNNLKELGFDWLLGPFSIGNGVYMSGGGAPPPTVDYPFVQPGQSIPIGTNLLTGGLRSGQGASPNSAISVNGLDALLAGLQSGSAPGILGLAGIFTNPQFQVVIRGLNQKKGIDLMSAPKVTTKSGGKAIVNIIREFRYPTEFDPPQIPQTVATSEGVITSGFTSSAIITPTTPSNFDTKNTGVTLEVEPIIGPDGYTIDLTLTPEVVDFEGFINYGTPILGLTSGGIIGGIAGPPRSTVISTNTINQPVFSTRKVSTSVTIWDGMTVALGGLIREDIQKVEDKVPLLGDIPLAGRLFRSSVDQKIKSNLIIFVTAKLIDAEGKPLRGTEEAEEIVEPLGLPEDLPVPQFPMKGSTSK